MEEAPLVPAHVKVAPRKSRKLLDKEKWDLLGCRVMKVLNPYFLFILITFMPRLQLYPKQKVQF